MAFSVGGLKKPNGGRRLRKDAKYGTVWAALVAASENGGAISFPAPVYGETPFGNNAPDSEEKRMWMSLRMLAFHRRLTLKTSKWLGRQYFWLKEKGL